MPARPPGGAGLPPARCLLPACSRRLGLWWRAGTDRHQALSAHSDSVPARRAAKWRRWVPGWDICPAGFWAPSPFLYPTNVPLLCLKPAWRGDVERRRRTGKAAQSCEDHVKHNFIIFFSVSFHSFGQVFGAARLRCAWALALAAGRGRRKTQRCSSSTGPLPLASLYPA